MANYLYHVPLYDLPSRHEIVKVTSKYFWTKAKTKRSKLSSWSRALTDCIFTDVDGAMSVFAVNLIDRLKTIRTWPQTEEVRDAVEKGERWLESYRHFREEGGEFTEEQWQREFP